MKKQCVMHVHFWGDIRKQAGSVDKVLAAFAKMDDPEIDVEIASLGEGPPETMGRANVCFFAEDHLKNKLLNKLLGLKVFTFSQLVQLINRRRPDLLHIHNRHALVDRLIDRLDYRPVVLCHFHRKFGDFVLPQRVDGLVTVSSAVRDALTAACSPKVPVEVIYNPVPADVVAMAAEVDEGNSVPARPKLLYGGGRQKNKGFFELEAALSSSDLAGRFDVTFCGPELRGYTPPFPASVRGLLTATDFLAELRRCDVLVMPSHHEGFSILALEALAIGKLIVGTTGGGLGEVLSDGNALIHAIGDTQDLAAKLATAAVLVSPAGLEPRLSLRRAARAAASRFSEAAINHDLAALYHRYLPSPQRA